MVGDRERELLIGRLWSAVRRSGRTRVARGLTQPWKAAYLRYLRAGGKAREVAASTFFGSHMTVVLPEHVSISIWRYGFVGADVCLFLLSMLPRGARFLDVGAHFGFFTLLGAHLVGMRGRVLALEPVPATYGILQKNTATRPYIETCPCAAFSETRSLTMYDYGVEFSAYNSTLPVTPHGHRRPSVKTKLIVQAKPIDGLLAERGWNGVDFVKIDTEASEEHVLKGLEQTLLRSRPAVVIEIGAYEAEGGPKQQHIMKWFEDRDYAPFEAAGTAIMPHRGLGRDEYANLLFLPDSHRKRITTVCPDQS